ncbi:unnamed protein product [Peronospora belbahrii]|uniref:PX domain-containing protein n=1 Tax=Peronospora belbahrii TaxID=622444 RepID=A0AAU9KRQ9_9STRA|nr:unnamed protein product [Peronospora belbahrii]CAH0521993.1 unnamed protein product [Peronospora belbahrii]
MVGTMIESSSYSASTNASTSSISNSTMAPWSAANLKRAGPVAVPETVAWLNYLTLELTTSSSSNGKMQYQLTMQYRPSQHKVASCATWSVSRSFDEYKGFQKRLLKRLQPGHSCSAECRWLYKVAKHYFPQKSLFCNNCPKVVAARQQTLIRCLTTIQASLVNRGNHSCCVLIHDVAAEFNRFVVKGMKDLEANATTADSTELSAVTRDSLDSLDLDDDSELEDEEEEEEEEEEERECDACHSRHVVCRTHSNLKA